jgi:GNAT superfamily N-acetyltransferase
MNGNSAPDELRAVRLSTLAPGERAGLLGLYEATVYTPAFPDAEIREDPAYWLGRLDADPPPPPPQPLIEVILLVARGGAVAGGATIELYRAAGCGLLTYIAIHADRRGQGLGRQLVNEARAALTRMAGGDAPMFAETERLEDAEDDAERAGTVLRQTQLAGLGARVIDFDYIMPPLRPDTSPHRLHLLAFDPPQFLSGRRVLGLLDELARALGTDLTRFEDTRRMAEILAKNPELPTGPLPAARPR